MSIYEKFHPLKFSQRKIQGEFRLIHYLSWILLDKFAMVHCVHILDGFLFIGYPISPELCYTDGFTPSDYIIYWYIDCQKKTVFLCTTIKFMGLELDYIKFEIKLSEDKLLRLQKFNNVLKKKRTDTLRELRSLICLLNFSVELMISWRASKDLSPS